MHYERNVQLTGRSASLSFARSGIANWTSQHAVARLGITNNRRHAGPETQRVAEGRARSDVAFPRATRSRSSATTSRSSTGAVDVALVEAGEHLEIGRHAIRRLRQRPELVATRILLCIEVARVSGPGPGDGRRRLHPDAGQRRRAGGAAAPAARARQAPGLAAAGSLRRGRAGLRDAAGVPARAGAGADALRIPAAALPGRSRGPRVHAARSCCRACGATATSAASAPSTRTC